MTAGRRGLVAVLAALLVVALAPAAGAQTPPETVTLKSSSGVVVYGAKVTLSGKVTPAEEGVGVTILDENDVEVATATTDADGKYATIYKPERSIGLRAERLATTSEVVRIGVKPIVEASLYHVRLFGRAKVVGRVTPALLGEMVTVKLRRNGRVTAKKKVSLTNGRRFNARFRIRKPGRYTVRASVDPTTHRYAGATSNFKKTKLPSLSIGSKNIYVKLLEKRLIKLGYYMPGANETYDVKTRDAMIAFNKVQRRARVGSVDAATWRRLASPIKPKPRAKSDFHIEIDQTRQVIFYVKNGKVRWILHTSTGAGGATRDGVWRVWGRTAGYTPKRLYYPSFFDGERAIHGWESVPTYPASHGCSRIPMWAATWAYDLGVVGTTVRIYH